MPSSRQGHANRSRLVARVVAAIVFASGLASCDIPHDAGGSWSRAQVGGLRVGIVLATPGGERAAYIAHEQELLRDFAAEHELAFEAVPGAESELVELLSKRELHVVAGGFSEDTLWKRRATLTSTYDHHHVLLVPKGENRLLVNLESTLRQAESRQ